MFVQKQLQGINVNIIIIILTNDSNHKLITKYDNIFPKKIKFQSLKALNNMLTDCLVHAETNNIIATDASVNNEKADVGIASDLLDWSFSVRLPDLTPVIEAELVAFSLAPQRTSVKSKQHIHDDRIPFSL